MAGYWNLGTWSFERRITILDDGAYLVSRSLIELAKLPIYQNRSLPDLIANLKDQKKVQNFGLNFMEVVRQARGYRVIEQLKDNLSAQAELENNYQ